ncbi:MAG: hypothetical protein HXY37_10905, partial [Chloroflexi bacterium]|nr:hypothetical protein [Chloroflexota bacterium]
PLVGEGVGGWGMRSLGAHLPKTLHLRGVALWVTDTGEGIPAEHLPNVFERFYRVDAARHNESGGSGLELAIVRSIVEAHGGEVSVTRAPGAGTTITCRLPDAGSARGAAARALACAILATDAGGRAR